VDGIVERICVNTPLNWSGQLSGAAIKIFRDDGTYYLYIDGETFTLYAGQHVYDLSGSLSIQSGDFIGIYTPSCGSPYYDSLYHGIHTNGEVYQSGNISSNSLKSLWTSDNYKPSIIGYFSQYVKTTGNDSLDGLSWANAWKTINKAATTVVDGVTIHIGFGTYDAEPSSNKIAPQNAGTLGIYYLPETAATGGGTGTVSVEQNT
jgi:hypothetical protein